VERVRAAGWARDLALVGLLVAVLGLAACASTETDSGPATALADDAITIASFNFPESELLAQLYGQALAARGFDVAFGTGRGPRELVLPALQRGLVELVPEYAGTALQFLSLGAAEPTADVADTRRALGDVLAGSRVAALESSDAENKNIFVVKIRTAARHGLQKISDLAPIAPQLNFGGPPECPSRPLCLGGLEGTYKLDFGRVFSLDAGGLLTHLALRDDYVDVALLFSTDPDISSAGLFALDDDLHLQPAENVTPLVRTEILDRWGAPLRDAVNAVSSRLTTSGLQRLNARMAEATETAETDPTGKTATTDTAAAGSPAERVAAAWLTEQGLR
jgi:osmoprotectant transport system substrate-binding protein